MGKIIEGYWKCSSCNTEDILGRHRECPNCGRPRGDDVTFYMKDTNAAQQDVPNNPDWYCDYCQSLNSDKDETCKSCGSPKSNSHKNYFDLQSDKKEKVEEIKQEDFENQKLLLKNNVSYSLTNIKNIFIYVGIALTLIAGIYLMVQLFSPKSDTLNITNLSWERSITVEQKKTVTENGWSLPSGGRLLYTTSEIKHYDSVVDHYETVIKEKSRQVVSGYETVTTGYEDMGNGYFEEQTTQQPVYTTEYYTETSEEPVYRQEPVYQTKYYYEIDRWLYERSITKNGNDSSPVWGEVVLDNLERENGRTESYTITALNKKNIENTYLLNYEKWKNISIGDSLDVTVNVFNQIIAIKE